MPCRRLLTLHCFAVCYVSQCNNCCLWPVWVWLVLHMPAACMPAGACVPLLPARPAASCLAFPCPSSPLHSLPSFPFSLPALPPCLALCFPDLSWQLCACLSGRFYQLLCRGGLCCCISGAAVLGGFVSFALLPCAVSWCPLVTAVCLPVWPLSPAPVPGWACCCILGAAAFGGFFSAFPPGGWLCCVSWPASCRATQLIVLGWHSPGARHFPCLSVRPIGQPVRCCAACTPPSLTQLRCICSITISW